MTFFMNPVKKIYRKVGLESGELVEEKEEVCPVCGKINLSSELKANARVCKICNYHYSINARDRIKYICDEFSFVEFNAEYKTIDHLNFDGYKEKIDSDRLKTGLNEAIITGSGKVNGISCILAVMDSGYRMGSMGTIVGQKILEAANRAITEKIPFVIYIASGGARMQEGMLSLMQMSKTAVAFDSLRKAGLMTVNILTNPTTGGVMASFAMLGDVLIAEPGATIGFAGKRVISQTIKSDLPEDFQTSEFLEVHGHIDDIVSRKQQKEYLSILLRESILEKNTDFDKLDQEYQRIIKKRKKSNLYISATEKLKLIRREDRPTAEDYIKLIFNYYIELHGDRLIEDDKSIVAKIGFLNGIKVIIIGQQRGKGLDDNIYRNFGMTKPSGFRKIKRIIDLANRLRIPIVSFIDTKGADPTADSEIMNQSYAIAECILGMVESRIPIVSIVIGEGGSGGALAIGTANRILMLENTLFSVISPEGAATILWKDRNKLDTALNNLKATAQDLKEMGIIDDIIPEPEFSASSDIKRQAHYIKIFLLKNIYELSSLLPIELYNERKLKYEKIGSIIKGGNDNG